VQKRKRKTNYEMKTNKQTKKKKPKMREIKRRDRK
jgi:hypothetical protein